MNNLTWVSGTRQGTAFVEAGYFTAETPTVFTQDFDFDMPRLRDSFHAKLRPVIKWMIENFGNTGLAAPPVQGWSIEIETITHVSTSYNENRDDFMISGVTSVVFRAAFTMDKEKAALFKLAWL